VASGAAWPATAGTPAWCHGFCQRENKQNNIITLQRTTSAKTRATPKRRQQHIPPNVMWHLKTTKNEEFINFPDYRIIYVHSLSKPK
jgi:hypothetical protein